MAVVPLKKFVSVNRIIIGLFVFLSLYSGALYAFATTYVAPGATLDPSGLPGDYTVGPLLSYGEAITTGHDNEVLYVDGNGDLASDDGFYRNSITKDTYILQPQSGGLDIGGIAVGEDILGIPGTDGAVFRRGDLAGTEGNAVLGVIDVSPLGAPSRFAVFGNSQDLNTGEQSLFFMLPQNFGIQVRDASSSGGLSVSPNNAFLQAGNTDFGSDDLVGIIADYNGGGGNQFVRASYKDGTNNYGWGLDSDGFLLDFDDFSGTSGTYYYFPTSDATIDGQVLTAHADGTTTWETLASPTAPLTDTYIGFGNNSNELYGSSNFTYNRLYSLVTQTVSVNSDGLSYGSASFTGSGLDDLTLTWNSSIYASNKYGGNLTITIDTTGTPDTFTWYFTGGYSQIIGTGTSVAITGGVQNLTDADGNKIAEIQFGATTGHTFNDRWNASTSLGGNQKGYLLRDTSNHEFLTANPGGGAYRLGDYGTGGGSTWWGNGTKLEIQDGSGVMYLDVPNDIYIETPGSGGYQVGHFDMMRREVQFGDLDIVGNKTRLALSDPSNTVYVTASGVNAFSVYNANYDEQYFAVNTLSGGEISFGDLDDAHNRSKFSLNDSLSKAIFDLDDQFNIRATTFNSNNYYFNAGYNGGNPIINFGDTGGFGNGTTFGLNDQNQSITAAIDGTFRIQNTAGQSMFIADIDSAPVFIMGDYMGAFNGTKFVLDDASHFSQLTSETFLVQNSGSDHLLSLDGSIGLYQIGDLSSAGNESKLVIDDSISFARLSAGLNTKLSLDDSISFVSLQTGANTELTLDDSISFVRLKTGTTSRFSIDDSITYITMETGDDTEFSLDDSLGLVSVRADNGILVNDNNGHTCTIDANGGTCTSDERLKTNIVDLPGTTLENLLNLRTVTYTWNSGNDITTQHIGFLAQNMQAYYPELVETNPDGYLGVNYAGLAPVLVEAIRELDLKISPLSDLMTENNSVADSLRAFLGNAQNKVTRIFTGEICLYEEGEDSECITRSELHELKQILANQNNTSGGGTGSGNTVPTNGDSGSGSTDAGDTGGDTGDGNLIDDTTNVPEGTTDGTQNTLDGEGDTGTLEGGSDPAPAA